MNLDKTYQKLPKPRAAKNEGWKITLDNGGGRKPKTLFCLVTLENPKSLNYLTCSLIFNLLFLRSYIDIGKEILSIFTSSESSKVSSIWNFFGAWGKRFGNSFYCFIFLSIRSILSWLKVTDIKIKNIFIKLLIIIIFLV